MRAAVIDAGVITNVIMVESLDLGSQLKSRGLIQGDLVEIDEGPGIGWTYDGSTFTAPPPDPNLEMPPSE